MSNLIFSMLFSFFKIGAFSFGGGYAVLALIEREIISTQRWISAEEFVNIVGIAEMTPGPIAVNSSTFVGYNLFGVLGGILCSLATITIPFILSLVVSMSFSKFKDNITLKKALCGIRPAVIGLIAAACITIGKISLVDYYSIAFFLFAFLLVWKFKVNPILTLVICGILGSFVYSI